MAKVRTLPSKKEKLHDIAEDIRYAAREVIECVQDIGEKLTEAKALMDHGEWSPWLEREFGWTDRTARNYMSVARCFKTETVSDLDIDLRALYALSKRDTPEEVREAAVELARTQHVSHAKVTEMLRAYAAPPKPRPRTTAEIEEDRLGWLDHWFDQIGRITKALADDIDSQACFLEETNPTPDDLAAAAKRNPEVLAHVNRGYSKLLEIKARIEHHGKLKLIKTAASGR